MSNTVPLADRVRQVMQEWPAYHATDDLVVHDVMGRMLFIGYNLQQGHHWHANIQGRTFYLTKIKLPSSMRGVGLGDQLYKCIERVAWAAGCEQIRQTPSGRTYTGETRMDYLLRRGWLRDDEEVYKKPGQ